MSPADPYAGLSAEDRVRAKAGDDNAKGIAENRRRIARLLQAPPGPARATLDRWSALPAARTQPVSPEDWTDAP